MSYRRPPQIRRRVAQTEPNSRCMLLSGTGSDHLPGARAGTVVVQRKEEKCALYSELS